MRLIRLEIDPRPGATRGIRVRCLSTRMCTDDGLILPDNQQLARYHLKLPSHLVLSKSTMPAVFRDVSCTTDQCEASQWRHRSHNMYDRPGPSLHSPQQAIHVTAHQRERSSPWTTHRSCTVYETLVSIPNLLASATTNERLFLGRKFTSSRMFDVSETMHAYMAEWSFVT